MIGVLLGLSWDNGKELGISTGGLGFRVQGLGNFVSVHHLCT